MVVFKGVDVCEFILGAMMDKSVDSVVAVKVNDGSFSMREFRLHFLCGSIAGVISDAMTHPIDTVRANMQYERGFSNLRYRSTFEAFKTLFRDRGLYRGFGSVAATTIPAHGLYFAGFEIGTRWYQSFRPNHEFEAHLFGGLVADIAGSMVWVPADVIKQRVQLSADKSSLAAAKRVMATEGLRGFYRGYWPALATYGPFVSIYFAMYEYMKQSFKHPESVIAQVTCGSAAAIIASGLTNPLDVIKTRVQVDSLPASTVFRTLMREEGVRALTKGMMARMSWIAPSCAIGIVSYEQAKLLLI